MMSFGGSSSSLWQELLPDDSGTGINELVKKQYDVVYGTWPSAYNEIVLVLDENNELDDMTLYALGLEPKEKVDAIMRAALDKTELENDHQQWDYDTISKMEFHTVLNADCFRLDEQTGFYTDLRESDAGLQYLYDNGIPLKVTGIIRPNEDTTAPMLTGSIAYTSDLTRYVIDHTQNAEVIQAQKENPSTDILTGLPFQESTGTLTDADKAASLRSYLNGLDEAGKAQAYVQIMSIPSEEQLQASVQSAETGKSRADMESVIAQALTQQMGMQESEMQAYTASMEEDEIKQTYTQIITEQIKAQYAQQMQEQLASMQPKELAAALEQAMQTDTDAQCAQYYDSIMTFSDSTYEENLTKMGEIDLDTPASINLYAASFEDKDVIEDAIASYNADKDELSQIKYTDYVGLMMSSITTIIHTITYVLIAFVAISLIVSSIMIGVITLISVQERTKEIGILRAIGASKRDVSSMFNAETIIIGLAAGLLGVLVTYLLCIPINIVVHHLTGIQNLNAILPIPAALILIAISVLLTLISGLIPSRSAAKKDPVVALRSE